MPASSSARSRTCARRPSSTSTTGSCCGSTASRPRSSRTSSRSPARPSPTSWSWERRPPAFPSRRCASRPAMRRSRSGAPATGADEMTGPGPATDLLADEPLDEEIVEDGETAGGDITGTTAAGSWRGPSVARWMLFAGIAIAVLVVDQLAKAWVVGNLEVGKGIEVLGEWLRIVHWRNSGALFGLLPQSAPIFAVVSLGVVALIVAYHRRAGRGYLTTVALALLLGGAIGNLLDRLRYGSVVDFVDMGVGQWRFYTYNAADAAITTAILLLIAMAIVPRLAEWGAGGAVDG